MAIDKTVRYPGRWGAVSAEYPLGQPKNRTSPTAKDGTYLEKDWISDYEAFFASLMDNAGFSANGSVDEVGASQFYDALLAILKPAEVQFITASDTYIPSAGVRAIEFVAIGGGGGGGGIDGQGAGTSASSAAGAAGATAILRTSTIDASYTLTIGAGGAGGVAGDNDGTAGGDTTISSTSVSITAGGGSGGSGNTGSLSSIGEIGASGGAATGGDLNISGGDSSPSRVVEGEIGALSVSGASYLGGGGRTGVSADGIDGKAYGSGGGGSSSTNLATDNAGGDGRQGVIIIREFF